MIVSIVNCLRLVNVVDTLEENVRSDNSFKYLHIIDLRVQHSCYALQQTIVLHEPTLAIISTVLKQQRVTCESSKRSERSERSETQPLISFSLRGYAILAITEADLDRQSLISLRGSAMLATTRASSQSRGRASLRLQGRGRRCLPRHRRMRPLSLSLSDNHPRQRARACKENFRCRVRSK